MALCSVAMALGIVGVLAGLRRLLFRRSCGGRWRAACGARGGRRRGIGRSRWLGWLFETLDTTPGQEREIRAALEELRDRAEDARRGLGGSREAVGRALAAETFDDAAFESASAHLDATTAKVKDAVAGALRRIHAALDPKQRERLAEIVGRAGFGPWRRWGGPYRGGARG